MIVTIDGPAGTGKSTVARAVAQALQWQYLDTGAMYRLTAWLVLQSGGDPRDETVAALHAQRSRIRFNDRHVFTGTREVTAEIRTPEVTEAASLVAQHPAVRAALVEQQRRIAGEQDIVCEGRDQGTVVFPHAAFKFFLIAQPEIRAQRRLAELSSQGKTVVFDVLLQQIQDRDQRDAERAVAPLRPATDAITIDTSDLTSEEVVQKILSIVRPRS